MHKILIADDEIIERQGLKTLIERRNLPVEVLLACDGEEALSIIHSKKIDVLITDIKMPKMNGLELCRKAREIDPKMFIIVQSAYDDFDYMQEAIRVQVNDYILKPILISEFDALITRALNMLDNDAEKDDKESPANREQAIINKVVTLIEEHYSENIGLAWIAEQVGLSSAYLSALFKNVKGSGVAQCLIATRMERAKQLLCQTHMRITDVGLSVGYINTSYFCQQFRKYFGITASAMREEHRK